MDNLSRANPLVISRECRRKFRSRPLSRAHGDCTLPLQEPDDRGHRVLGRNGDAHMHMVQLQMPFDDVAFLLPGQGMKNRLELGTDLPEQDLPPRRLRINTGICSFKKRCISKTSTFMI